MYGAEELRTELRWHTCYSRQITGPTPLSKTKKGLFPPLLQERDIGGFQTFVDGATVPAMIRDTKDELESKALGLDS